MGLLDNQTQNQYYTGTSQGSYQFETLKNIINNFMYAYVGEGKILAKVNRADVQFHAMRAIQELSYDVFRSVKSQEIEVPPSLKMMLPQDYVNYVKLVTIDGDGIEKIIYPTGKTSNPFAITQDATGAYDFSPHVRKFTITIPSNGGSDLSDGDYISLPFKNNSGNDDNVFFIFDDDTDGEEGQNPVDSLANPRFYIQFQSTDTQASIASQLEEQIMDFGHHKVTDNSGGVLTIEYTDGFFIASTTPNLSTTEGAYQEDTAIGGANGTMITIAVSNAGTADTDLLEQVPSDTWNNYQDQTMVSSPSNSTDSSDIELDYRGRRYGLDPQYAQANGTFFIDYLRGYIHFGSSLSGKTVVLKYISDGLGTDEEMVVHKFCEEAVYKWIAYGVLSCRTGIPD